MSDGQAADAAGGEGTQTATGEGAAPSVDLTPITAALDEMRGGQDELRQIVNQLVNAGGEPGEDGDGDDGGFDLGFLEDPEPDPAVVGQQLAALVDQRAQAMVAPALERVAKMENEQRLSDLVSRIPDMKDPEVARQVIQATHVLGDQFGWDAQMRDDPRIWELVHMAGKAAQLANQEGDGTDPGVAVVEGGGGARPSPMVEDPGKAIIGARRGASVLDF